MREDEVEAERLERRLGRVPALGRLDDECYRIHRHHPRECEATQLLEPAEKEAVSQAEQLYREAGWRGFWRGFLPCVLRAFPANAAAFGGFAVAMDTLRALEAPRAAVE